MIVEVAALSIVLSQSPERRREGDAHVCVSSPNSVVLTVDGQTGCRELMSGTGLEAAIAQDFSLEPEVSAVLTESAEGNLLIWVGVDNPTSEVRDRIFDKQMSLIDGFPEVEFDFNLVATQGRSAKELVSNAKVVYSRRG